MNNLQTHIENYLKYGHTQKCLDEKTLKAYRIDLNQFSQQTYKNHFQHAGTIYFPTSFKL